MPVWVTPLAITVSCAILAFTIWRIFNPKQKLDLGPMATVWFWRQAAVLGAGPVITVLLIWQLWSLDERHWCRITNEGALDSASALQKLNACIQVLRDILGIKDHTIIGLLCMLGMVIGLFIVTEFRTRLKVNGPMGTGMEIGGDDDAPKV